MIIGRCYIYAARTALVMSQKQIKITVFILQPSFVTLFFICIIATVLNIVIMICFCRRVVPVSVPFLFFLLAFSPRPRLWYIDFAHNDTPSVGLMHHKRTQFYKRVKQNKLLKGYRQRRGYGNQRITIHSWVGMFRNKENC